MTAPFPFAVIRLSIKKSAVAIANKSDLAVAGRACFCRKDASPHPLSLEHVVIDVLSNGLALQFAGVLVKTEMNSAIDTSVGNIVGDLS